MIGKSIENYKIIEVLGQGGMGVVYKAVDTDLDRTVALKVMNPSVASNEEFLARFKSEARVLGRLQHPHIVNVYAFRHVEPHLFIVMEYVGGGTLSDLINQYGAIPQNKALPIIKECLSALSFAHDSNIIHRDIKPQNVLLTGRGKVKFSDFGLAKIQEDTSMHVTRAGVSGGTLYYMPPEQAEALNKVDHRGDIYSFGMTMYHLLAGRLPFDKGASMLSVLKTIDEQRFPLPTSFNPELPEGLSRVIMRSLRKNPDERFQSMNEVLEAVEHYETIVRNQAPTPGTRVFTSVPTTKIAPAAGFNLPPKNLINRKTADRTPSAHSNSQIRERVKPIPIKEEKSRKERSLLVPVLGFAGLLLIALLGWFQLGGQDEAPPEQTQTNPQQPVDLAQNNSPGQPGESTPPPSENETGSSNETGTPAIEGAPVIGNEGLLSIWIDSEPSEASVLLDGVLLGVTPMQIEDLESRPYDITLRKQGYTELSQLMDPGNQDSLQFTLAEAPVQIRQPVITAPPPPQGQEVFIRANPYGSIYINGEQKSVDANVNVIEFLEPGSYTIRAEHSGLGAVWEKTIQVPGAPENVFFDFDKEYQVLVTSEPINARIFVNGAYTDSNTPTRIKVHPGNHTFSVELAGYRMTGRPISTVVEGDMIDPDAPNKIHFVLEQN